MTKYNCVKSAVAGTAAALYSLVPQVGEAQTNKGLESLTEKKSISIQRGLQAPKSIGETKTHILYEMPFNKDLQNAIQNSSNPYLITTSKDSYVKFNKDSTSLILSLHKNDLGKKIGVGVRDNSAISPCDTNGLGSVENSLPFTYLTINETQSPTPRTQSSPRDTIIQRVNEYNIVFEDNSTTEINFYEAKKDLDKKEKKKSGSGLRASLEGNTSIDGKTQAGTLALQPKIANGLYIGPFVTLGNGKTKSQQVENVSYVTNITDAISTQTRGTETRDLTSQILYETGIRTSIDTRDKRASFNLDLGVQKQRNIISETKHEGEDMTLRNGEVNNTKPYCYETGEKETLDDVVGKVGFNIQVHPFKNSGFFLTAGVDHTLNKKEQAFKTKDTQVKFGLGFAINKFKGRKKK